MKTEKTIEQLKEAMTATDNPMIKKELSEKIKALTDNTTVNK